MATVAEDVANGVLNVAIAATTPTFTFNGFVRKEPRRHTADPDNLLIVSQANESEVPDGGAKRQIKRTFAVIWLRKNDGKLKDVGGSGTVFDWREPTLKALANLEKLRAGINAIDATIKVVNCSIESRMPFDSGMASMVFDVAPIVVTVTTQEGY